MSSVVADEADCFNSESRSTKDGRRITYECTVVQNPEKARACGQGAKSSTDRRPVDPPPIIQLQVFDEDADSNGRKDITVHYRANFFMYAELEFARQIAPGRTGRDSNEKPILCGSPVSGISYLDRPQAAGYFIFPDLSVRHEGRYRLTFTLWEELKDRGLRDADDDRPETDLHQDDHVTSRCQVKSAPFMVYSAKKFPGLSESTDLSRVVAEQGCRVRIRRDVRMRRHRETKDSKFNGSDDEEGESTRAPARRQSSPGLKHKPSLEQPSEPASRARSPTHGDNGIIHAPLQKTSAPDLNSQYHQQQSFQPPQMMAPSPQNGYPPPPPRSATSGSQHHYDPAAMPPQYGQYMHQQQVMHSPQPQISGFPQPPPQGPYHPYHAPAFYQPYQQNYGYMPQQQMPSPIYAPHNGHMRHDSVGYVASPQDYHAAPGSQQFPAPPNGHYHISNDPSRSGSIHHPNGSPTISSPQSHSHSENGSKNLPALQTHHQHDQPPFHHRQSYDGTPSALNPQAAPFYPSHSTSAPHGQQPPSYQPNYNSHPPPPPQYIAPTSAPPTSSKRSYGSTFDTQHIDQRLQSGARPDVDQSQNAYAMHSQQPSMAVADASDDEDDEPPFMEYKRADGTLAKRPWPMMR